MPKLDIPMPYRAGVGLLARLPDDVALDLATAIEQSPLILPANVGLERIASHVQGLSPDDSRSIVRTLLGLYAGRRELGWPVDEFAEAVSQSQDLDLSSDERALVGRRLQTFLAFEALAIRSKALALLNEHERRFHDAHVVTDLRPVFGDNIADGPVAAVIVHSLRIRYHHDPDHELEDVHISLDPTDINELRAQLDRADAKAKNLELFVRRAGIRYVSRGEE